MIKTIQSFNGREKMSTRLDTELVELLMPELRECKGRLDAVRRQTAIEIAHKWHGELVRAVTETMKDEFERLHKDREALAATKIELETARIKNQELQGDLHAAKEGRGIYEDKARTELQRQLTAKTNLVGQLTALEQTQRDTIQGLQAELRGRAAAIERYEYDVSQLTTAAAAGAEQVRKDKKALDDLIAEARVSLSLARDNIRSRWGHDLSPFHQSILDDIVTALTKLPPSISP